MANPEGAEAIWKYQRHFVELDKMGPEKKGEEGNELDQFWSAKFIEDMDSAITAQKRKEALREIDQDNNGKMALIECEKRQNLLCQISALTYSIVWLRPALEV